MKTQDEKKTELENAIQEKTLPAEMDTGENQDNYIIYTNNIYSYVDDFISEKYSKVDRDELKNTSSFFPALVNYLYNNYIGDLLNNKITKDSFRKKNIYPDITVLNDLFNIYISLVYDYKWNNRPTIIEFGIFTGIDHNTFIKWNKGDFNNNYNNNTGSLLNINGEEDSKRILTSSYTDSARKWLRVCESALVDGSGEYVKEIFLLKACFGYRDNNNDINITVNHKALISADQLPDLIGITEK